MSEISIPYHLAVPAVLSIVIILIVILKWKKLLVESPKKLFWISLIVFCVIYALIVGGATHQDILYQLKLNSFDLDKDGFFGEIERTEEQKAAMDRLISDVGRNFSVIVGLFIAGIMSLVAYVISWVIERYLKLKKEETQN